MLPVSVDTTFLLVGGPALGTGAFTTVVNSVSVAYTANAQLFQATPGAVQVVSVCVSDGVWVNLGSGYYSLEIQSAQNSVDNCLIWAEVSATGIAPFQTQVYVVGSPFTDQMYNQVVDRILLRETSAAENSALGDNEGQYSLLGVVKTATHQVSFGENIMEVYNKAGDTVDFSVSTQGNVSAVPVVKFAP